MYFKRKKDDRDGDSSVVDRCVTALINCAECYLQDNQVMFMLLTSLMKLTVGDMTSKHA